MTREIHHFIDGKTFKGSSGQFGEVFNPNTGEVQARVQFATPGEVAKLSRPPRPRRSSGPR